MEETTDFSILAANYIVDRFTSINKSYIDIKAIAKDIQPIINTLINELIEEDWYMVGLYKEGKEPYWSDLIDVANNVAPDIIEIVIRRLEIHDGLVDDMRDVIFKFITDIQPSLYNMVIEKRKQEVSKHVYPQLANIATDY